MKPRNRMLTSRPALFEGLESRRLMAADFGVSSFTLINADTNQPIATLQQGATIDLASLPTKKLNIRADVTGKVESVRFGLDNKSSYSIENDAVYALAGDKNGDYKAWTPTLGAHTLTATPYSQNRARGVAGEKLTLNFTVIDSGKPAANPSPAPTNPTTPTTPTNPAPTPNPSPVLGAYQEANGVLIIEAESAPATNGWSERTAIEGFTGAGYIQATGSAANGSPGNTVITYKIQINNAGDYEFRWRNRITGEDSTEANDSWLKFSGGSNIAGQYAISGWTKVYMNQTNVWSWKASTKDHDPQVIRRHFEPGVYTIQVAVRSPGHAIDRLVLFNYGQMNFNGDTFTNAPESAKAA